MLGGLILIVFLIAVIAGGWFWRYAHAPLAIERYPQEFTLEHGTSMKAAARQLAEAGIVDDPQLLSWLARFTGQAARLKAGSYELTGPTSPLQLLDKLTEGDVTLGTLTLIEGWNLRQLRAALARNPDLRHDSASLSDAELLQAVGDQSGRQLAEGMFFPDTYHFAKGSSELAVLKRAYKSLQQNLAHAWEARSANLPLSTPYEALILASLVEKETGRPSDRSLIAAVFVNRLRIGMRLQTDPAVIYGMGEQFDGNLRKADLLADGPYNTYTRAGLPPSPIAMPGMAALHAAVNPAPSKALYFVAMGDGRSYFSETLVEHNQAVRRYQLGK